MIIEWTEDGYPTEESLQELEKSIENSLKTKDFQKAFKIFYGALKENCFDCCGEEQVEVRGEILDVWGYHTEGWSGNEIIINTLKKSWLFDFFLERYDKGGHYYFTLIKDIIEKLD